jgi:hypothetical protein
LWPPFCLPRGAEDLESIPQDVGHGTPQLQIVRPQLRLNDIQARHERCIGDDTPVPDGIDEVVLADDTVHIEDFCPLMRTHAR